jgi:hypothetical protein
MAGFIAGVPSPFQVLLLTTTIAAQTAIQTRVVAESARCDEEASSYG